MKKAERQSRKSKIRRIELGIWLTIILVTILLGVFLIIRHEKSFETHKIIMPDVDGLIVGSPVNMMGIPIGYITKTKIINDEEVVVKFKITSKEVHIPKGTTATVEFSGLGGSKSLELYPPDDDKMIAKDLITNPNGHILVERPKRLRDCLVLLFQMYQTIMNMIYSVTAFNNELSTTNVMPVRNNPTEMIQFMNYADTWIDNSHKSLDTFKKLIYKNTENGVKQNELEQCKNN